MSDPLQIHINFTNHSLTYRVPNDQKYRETLVSANRGDLIVLGNIEGHRYEGLVVDKNYILNTASDEWLLTLTLRRTSNPGSD